MLSAERSPMMEARFATPIICPVLIGRKHDLTTLHLLVERAKSGQGQVALVCGEAGIGKSRLVAEVKTEAVSCDFLLLQGSCFPTDHPIPYAPLLDLLRSHFSSHSEAKPAPEVERITQAFLPLLPDLSYVLPGGTSLPTLTPLEPEQEKRRRFETLAHFLTSQARVHPVLCVLEDLHWSDDTSLEFLHYLARRCAAHRLLLLLTYRSDEVRSSLRHFLAQLDRERLAQEILLARLTRDEVEAMLQAIFALPRSARVELAALLYTLTEGNPFFIEEILKSLMASGEIYHANGRWQRKELGELHIPRSVQDAVQQRTDQLSESARRVLILAAVAGRRFDFALLQALTRHDEDHLLQLFKELMAALVLATGAFPQPKLPTASAALSGDIYQISTSEYRNPQMLSSGAVLVVGTGQSGCQIAEELHESGRQVYLSTSSCGRVPRRYRGKDTLWWLSKQGFFDKTLDQLPSSTAKFACNPHVSGNHGGHDINLRQFARQGMILLGHVQAAQGKQLLLAPDLEENLARADAFERQITQGIDEYITKTGMEVQANRATAEAPSDGTTSRKAILTLDLQSAGISTIIWASGYQLDLSWVQLPVFDQAGYPVHQRGVTAFPGLYFLGLHWLYKRKSALLYGVGEDAAFIASAIADRGGTMR